MIAQREELTAREREQMQHDKEMLAIQCEHTQKVKAMELEIAKIEARWSSVLKLPLTVARLPFLLVMGVAYCISVARKYELPENFWKLVK